MIWSGFDWSMLSEEEKKYMIILVVVVGVMLVISAAIELNDHFKKEGK